MDLIDCIKILSLYQTYVFIYCEIANYQKFGLDIEAQEIDTERIMD